MNRYRSQIKFIGEKEQELLATKSAAIIGLGAIGSVAAELLTRAGMGHITLIDHDIVDLSNLQRQLYDETDVNKTKASAILQKLQKINSGVSFTASTEHFAKESKLKTDIILDCTDNLETRFAINQFCKKNNIPWVHAAAAGSIGVVLPINHDYCFSCVFEHAKNALTCDEVGILNTTSFTTAAMQVTEAIKILLKKPHSSLIRFHLWNNTFDHIIVKRAPDCKVCNDNITNGRGYGFQFKVEKCKTRAAYAAKPNKNIKLNLTNIKNQYETLLETPIVIIIKDQDVEIIVHNYGELIFKQFSDEEKIKKIAEEIYTVGK